MKPVLVASALLWLFGCAGLAETTNDLLSVYPLHTNGEDVLGRNPPFVLTNTPFVQGAVYVNGVYEPNGHFVNYLSTGPLEGLRYNSFTISLNFCPDPKARKRRQLSVPEEWLNWLTRDSYGSWMGYGNNDERNIVTGGQLYRWLGFSYEHGRLNLTLNNGQFAHQYKGVKVQPNRWHTLVCSVDLDRKQIHAFFDGRKLETVELPVQFKLEVIGSPDRESDRKFTFANYSSGSVFRGYAANFKIFGHSLSPAEMALLRPSSSVGLPTFPTHPGAFLLPVAALLVLVVFLVLIVRRCISSQGQQEVRPGN